LVYENELKQKRLSEDERKILHFKIAQSYHSIKDSGQAFEIVKTIEDMPPDYNCRLLTFKLELYNDLKLHKKNSATVGLIEDFEGRECHSDSKLEEAYYANMGRLYSDRPVTACQKHLLKGNLRKDIGDIFASLEYYKKALVCNPVDEDFFRMFTDSALEAVAELSGSFNSKEIQKFFRLDYPRLFVLLSELYSKDTPTKNLLTAKMAQDLDRLTHNFIPAKVVTPLTIYSSLAYQNEMNLVKTFRINEKVKIFKIDEDTESKYVTLSIDEKVLGITKKVSNKLFMTQQ